jgi:hypothetical protein
MEEFAADLGSASGHVAACWEAKGKVGIGPTVRARTFSPTSVITSVVGTVAFLLDQQRHRNQGAPAAVIRIPAVGAPRLRSPSGWRGGARFIVRDHSGQARGTCDVRRINRLTNARAEVAKRLGGNLVLDCTGPAICATMHTVWGPVTLLLN